MLGNLRNMLSQVRTTSIQVRNISSQVKKLSFQLRDLPCQVRDVSFQVRNMSSQVRNKVVQGKSNEIDIEWHWLWQYLYSDSEMLETFISFLGCWSYWNLKPLNGPHQTLLIKWVGKWCYIYMSGSIALRVCINLYKSSTFFFIS